MDYLKSISNQLNGRISSQSLYNWNHDQTSLRLVDIKAYKGRRIEINEFGSLFEIGINIESNFSFSLNIPDKIFSFTKPSTVKDFPYNLYFSDNNDPNVFNDEEFLSFWYAFSTKIKDLELSKNEGVFFYNNKMYLALNSIRDVISILNDNIDIINSNPSIFNNGRERICPKNVPEKLRPLIPLLKRWSVGDDSERDLLIEEASEKQKNKLVKTVTPYLPEINEFLDSLNGKPLSHEAILMGNLAELVSELMIS